MNRFFYLFLMKRYHSNLSKAMNQWKVCLSFFSQREKTLYTMIRKSQRYLQPRRSLKLALQRWRDRVVVLKKIENTLRNGLLKPLLFHYYCLMKTSFQEWKLSACYAVTLRKVQEKKNYRCLLRRKGDTLLRKIFSFWFSLAYKGRRMMTVPSSQKGSRASVTVIPSNYLFRLGSSSSLALSPLSPAGYASNSGPVTARLCSFSYQQALFQNYHYLVRDIHVSYEKMMTTYNAKSLIIQSSQRINSILSLYYAKQESLLPVAASLSAVPAVTSVLTSREERKRERERAKAAVNPSLNPSPFSSASVVHPLYCDIYLFNQSEGIFYGLSSKHLLLSSGSSSSTSVDPLLSMDSSNTSKREKEREERLLSEKFDYYLIGEGILGKCYDCKKPIVYYYHPSSNDETEKERERKIRYLLIPLFLSSSSNEILGILQFSHFPSASASLSSLDLNHFNIGSYEVYSTHKVFLKKYGSFSSSPSLNASLQDLFYIFLSLSFSPPSGYSLWEIFPIFGILDHLILFYEKYYLSSFSSSSSLYGDAVGTGSSSPSKEQRQQGAGKKGPSLFLSLSPSHDQHHPKYYSHFSVLQTQTIASLLSSSEQLLLSSLPASEEERKSEKSSSSIRRHRAVEVAGEAVVGRKQSTTTVITPAANNKMIQKEINLLGRLNHKILTSPSKLPQERTIVGHLPSSRTSKLLERQQQRFLKTTTTVSSDGKGETKEESPVSLRGSTKEKQEESNRRRNEGKENEKEKGSPSSPSSPSMAPREEGDEDADLVIPEDLEMTDELEDLLREIQQNHRQSSSASLSAVETKEREMRLDSTSSTSFSSEEEKETVNNTNRSRREKRRNPAGQEELESKEKDKKFLSSSSALSSSADLLFLSPVGIKLSYSLLEQQLLKQENIYFTLQQEIILLQKVIKYLQKSQKSLFSRNSFLEKQKESVREEVKVAENEKNTVLRMNKELLKKMK
jgi:hypothetical protein